MFSGKYSEILQNIYLIILCERLLYNSWRMVFCKGFVDISYENASFGILEESKWMDFIYFLTTIVFWVIKYLFRIDGDNQGVLAKDLTL